MGVDHRGGGGLTCAATVSEPRSTSPGDNDMSTVTHTAGTTTDRDRKRRGVVFLKFGLAGAALLGIAAAATSAAWSDDAWFSASATGATIELQGALDSAPTSWDAADTKTASLAIPESTFEDLVPGEVRTYDVHLHNAGSTPLSVAPVWQADPTNEALFQGVNPVGVALSEASAFTLGAGADKVVTVTVTAPDWTNADSVREGQTGAGWVAFTGTAVSGH